MLRLVEQALPETEPLWKPIEQAYRWVRAAAHVLSNAEEKTAAEVERAYGRVLSNIGLVKRHLGPLEAAMNHFLKVTRSYRPGLFHCYRLDDLPRTNNDLEQLFGQHRHHERRATGRKRAPLSTVLGGSVRLVAGVATRMRAYTAEELAHSDLDHWRKLRAEVRQRFALRAQGYRFRRDPDAYLAQLEELALKPSLLV
jgi:hypothetical protein